MTKVWLVLMLVILSGCGSSSGQRFQVAQAGYLASLTTMTTLSALGEVSLEDLEAFELVRSETEELLDEWSKALEFGESFTRGLELQMLLDRLAKIFLKLETSDARSPSDFTSPDRSIRWYRRVTRGSYLTPT